MKVYKKAILPLGFKANAVACGIKKSGKLDLALFYSKAPAKTACLFTSNKILAAPIKVNKRYLKENNSFNAVIVNSGNANCFTGKPGIEDALLTAGELSRALGIRKEGILLASTGIIGRRLPVYKIKKAIPDLAQGLSEKGIDKAKLAIMTTDTFVKEITVQFNVGDKTVTVCGIAKGAGMIAPNMACPEQSRGATMLTFIATDAVITQAALNRALRQAVDNSFNCITIDGCMSTNDSVMLLANSLAGNDLISATKRFNLFARALNTVCLELAKAIVSDAEGATKFIEVRVRRAKSFSEAKSAALAVANSNLFKTAMFAASPNVYGRIAAAVGASGAAIREDKLKISYTPLAKKEVGIDVSLGAGKAAAVIYTSDLTYEYIKINAEYN